MDTENTTGAGGGDTAALTRRAMAGDTRAFDLLIERHRAMAVHHAGRYLRGDHDRAQDAAQDAFVEAWRDLPALREPAAFGAWLRRIVFKHCDRRSRAAGADMLTEGVPSECTPATDAGGDPAEAAIRAQVGDRVRRTVEDYLPVGEQETVGLFYFGGMGHAETAAALGVPVGTVKRRLHSARKRLLGRGLFMSEMEKGGIDPATAARVDGELRSRYDEFSAAFARKDADGMIALLAPDYELVFQTSPVWSREKTAAGMREGVALPYLVAQPFEIEEVLRVAPGGEEAAVRVRCRFQRADGSASTPTLRIDTWARDLGVAGGRWMLRRTESLMA